MKKIAFGCDHVGFILKHEIVAHLVERGVEVIDKGTWSSERTDYPHYASQVALAVAGGEVDGGPVSERIILSVRYASTSRVTAPP